MASIMSTIDNSENINIENAIQVGSTLGISMYPKGDPGDTYSPSVIVIEPTIDDGVVIDPGCLKMRWTNDTTGEYKDTDLLHIIIEKPTIALPGEDPEITMKVSDDPDKGAIQTMSFKMPVYGTKMTINGVERESTGSIFAPVSADVTDNNKMAVYNSDTNAAEWKDREELKLVTIDSNQEITSEKTFTNNLPKSSILPTDNNHLVNKQYVDSFPSILHGYGDPNAGGVAGKDGDIYFRIG